MPPRSPAHSLPAPTAGPATTATIAKEQRAAPVSSFGEVIAWSDYSDGAFHLMLDQGGKITPAPVPSSPTPFDVDLGTNRADRVVAVYSHDGALHELDIAAGTTKQLHPDVSGRLSDPTMSAGRYAFVARRRGRDVLYLRTLEQTDNAHGFASVIAGSDDDSSAPGSPTTVVLSGPAGVHGHTLSGGRARVPAGRRRYTRRRATGAA